MQSTRYNCFNLVYHFPKTYPRRIAKPYHRLSPVKCGLIKRSAEQQIYKGLSRYVLLRKRPKHRRVNYFVYNSVSRFGLSGIKRKAN